VTIAFWKSHSVARYVRSLAPFTPLTCSAALRFATLASLARSIHGLAHSLRSLPRGTVEIHESVFTLKWCSTGSNVIFVITRNTPSLSLFTAAVMKFKQRLINLCVNLYINRYQRKWIYKGHHFTFINRLFFDERLDERDI